MKEKYVEERYSRWMEFGTYKSVLAGPPDVNISDANDSLNVRVSPEAAKVLVERQNKLIDAICELALAFNKAAPEAFSKFWYGG